jgi:hypothetical protein
MAEDDGVERMLHVVDKVLKNDPDGVVNLKSLWWDDVEIPLRPNTDPDLTLGLIITRVKNKEYSKCPDEFYKDFRAVLYNVSAYAKTDKPNNPVDWNKCVSSMHMSLNAYTSTVGRKFTPGKRPPRNRLPVKRHRVPFHPVKRKAEEAELAEEMAEMAEEAEEEDVSLEARAISAAKKSRTAEEHLVTTQSELARVKAECDTAAVQANARKQEYADALRDVLAKAQAKSIAAFKAESAAILARLAPAQATCTSHLHKPPSQAE